ncbi:MAG: hypothetical protein JWL62_2566 [Hyphomicrobiales bacterium]|nr:hypothetical protein [Hyphomicrobiales bacterium]
MKKIVSSLFALTALGATAQAADLGAMKAAPAAPAYVSPWDYAIGASLKSDYNFRGISQSDRGAGVSGYGELRYNFTDTVQGYAGLAGSSVKLPTKPTMELDVYGGVRPTFGNLALDFGAIGYIYPKEQAILVGNGFGGAFINPANPLGYATVSNTDFFELYGKAAYTINDMFTVGANLFWSPNYLQSGASGTYASLTGKVTLPANFAVSGEFGRYWLGTSNAFLGNFNYPDYNYWNAGLSYSYKFATLDLRYHDTNLNKSQCFAITTDPRGISNGTGRSNWCGAAFIASLSFDLTSKDIK